jgi:Uncharacterized protein conserved in bacteria (DUF2325)
MSHQIAPDRLIDGFALNPFRSPDGGSVPFAPAHNPLPRLAERAVAHEVQRILAPHSHGRRKLWDFDGTLHCSIIGTCLTNVELRQVIVKLGLKEAASASEHDLHASGVTLAGKHHDGAKLLHKALDRHHRVAINQFSRAKSLNEVRALWQDAVQRGEIPGAYWAALTHPATNDALVREVFSEVHMLSHLVGAANRADIRRLRQLEAENANLQAKVQRQQDQLRDAIVARDATIRELRHALEDRIGRNRHAEPADSPGEDEAAWTALAADLKGRLTRSEIRRGRIEQQFEAAHAALKAATEARAAAERREAAFRHEIEAIEASVAVGNTSDDPAGDDLPLALTLLYVGGRPAQIGNLRALAERAGAAFLHHDGGVEDRGGLLPGLVSRADVALFPVDCVSHAAMSVVKRLCGQAGKPFVPLRSAGLAPFCAALKNPALRGARE